MKIFNKKLIGPKVPSLSRGFVALFTVLIAAVILSMAVGISTIALKQIVLSASATDANKSFYAADTGIECALYHDVKVAPTAFDTNLTSFFISCGGWNAGVFNSGGYFRSDTVDAGIPEGFRVRVGPDQEYCAYVTVDKAIVPGQTVITSKGHNAPCGTTNARVVERAIEVRY